MVGSEVRNESTVASEWLDWGGELSAIGVRSSEDLALLLHT